MAPGRHTGRVALVSALLTSFVVLAAASASAASLFSDGFESGGMTNWTTSQGVQVQSAIHFGGSFAARFSTTGTAAFAQKQLASSVTDLYMDARVYVVSQGGLTPVLLYKTSSGKKVLSLQRKKTGALELKNYITGAIVTSSLKLLSGTWHEVQLHGLVNGGSGLVEVWLDGAAVPDLGGPQDLGTAAIGQVEIAANQSTLGFDVVFDDVVVDTSFIGSGGTGPPGTPANLHTTSVSSSQVTLAWTASSGAADTYRIYRDGGQIDETPFTSYQDTGVQPSTQYSYTVDACNGVGCSDPTSPLLVTTPATGGTDPVIAAAGDIACDPNDSSFNGGAGSATTCKMRATSDLLLAGGYTAVLALGDEQYECGSSTAFAQSYDPSWGRVKAITYPAVGNHEYQTSGGTGPCGISGYDSYFGSRADPVTPGSYWYSIDIGTWHIVALDANCNSTSCKAGGPQDTWLKADLAAHPATCTLAFWHQPRFSSGTSSVVNYTGFQVLWNDLVAAHADVTLTGHRHWYERLGKMNESGASSPTGVREWVVGTGGKGLAKNGGNALWPTREKLDNQHFGVLELTLHPTSYDWRFLGIDGSVLDSGTDTCVV